MFGVVVLIVLLLPMWPAYLVSLFLPIPAAGLVGYWAIGRLRDMGSSSRTLAILSAFPLLGCLITIYLMAASPASPADRPA